MRSWTDGIDADRFVLRPIAEGDRDAFVHMLEVSQEHLRPWSPAPETPRTPYEIFQEELSRTRRGLESGGEARLVAIGTDGSVLGTFSLSQIFRRAFLNAYAGWSVSVEHVGQGIATEGVLGLLDLAFAAEPAGLGLHRVQANIIPSNAASVRVAEKCGFRMEGRAKEYLKIAGRWQDHLMYAKLAHEHELRFLGG